MQLIARHRTVARLCGFMLRSELPRRDGKLFPRLSAFSEETGVSTCAINCTSGIDEGLNPIRD